ncbi:beta-galactosidase 14-like [Andrographis paniculata]|uniref:beta-galactosidase 14-like n=1 Tax=Andrographis paniculata TaxID=175694 RepID=UPI0021E8E3BC|nr:beta-galactosidase 14-like [Andrographis paniculata]
MGRLDMMLVPRGGERHSILILILLSVIFSVTAFAADPIPNPIPNPMPAPAGPVVAYDSRSLIINGSRELLFSGSIHYPRSTPEMWPDILRKAREGGLNVVQTYIFWNLHEPAEGQYDFSGNKDFVKFIRMIGDQGMWVTLRLGPYIESEWNLGGFPYWLKNVPNITFRTYNEPFMFHMKRYTEKMINVVKEAKLFADQGGPIIMAQIENEYNNVKDAYEEGGQKYVVWAAEMATSLYNGVPWIMCKQDNAPPSIISTCNGRQCGDTFKGPGPNKPSLWTENWTAQYRVFGDPPSQRSAEDIAYSVARFFSRNGTLTNYYMYHGGTNFGRTASSFVTTRYYDEAPLDEYGLPRDPKYGHLRDLHRAMRLSKRALLRGNQNVQKISKDLEITTYDKPGDPTICAAFLTNNNTREDRTINFRGVDYFLPAKSISILPDCKTLVFNTQMVVAQHSSRNFVPSVKAKITRWEMFREKIPDFNELSIKSIRPMEMCSITNDTTDYAWYSTIIDLDRGDLPMRIDILPVLQIGNRGHALMVFVNGEYVGFGHGNIDEKNHVFKNSINLRIGPNQISILSMTIGMPNSGSFMERRFAGPRDVTIQGLMAGTLDITDNMWRHQVGLNGEAMELFTEEGSKKVQWQPLPLNNNIPQPLSWYKGYFDAPEGNNPIAVRMTSMAKGMIWINGMSIGRYWVSFLSPLGQPTQDVYHIPRSHLKPTGNVIVVLEETGGDPTKIEILLINRDTICSVIGDYYPPSVSSWELKKNQIRSTVDSRNEAKLTCPDKKVVERVEFASFGNAEGACGAFKPATCDSAKVRKVVEEQCLGKTECTVPYDRNNLMDNALIDPCPTIPKTLAIQLKCAPPPGAAAATATAV